MVDVTMLVLTPDPPEIKVRSNGVGSAGCPLRGVQNGFLSSMFLTRGDIAQITNAELSKNQARSTLHHAEPS